MLGDSGIYKDTKLNTEGCQRKKREAEQIIQR